MDLAILKEVTLLKSKELCCIVIGEVEGRGKESWLLCRRCSDPEDQWDSNTSVSLSWGLRFYVLSGDWVTCQLLVSVIDREVCRKCR